MRWSGTFSFLLSEFNGTLIASVCTALNTLLRMALLFLPLFQPCLSRSPVRKLSYTGIGTAEVGLMNFSLPLLPPLHQTLILYTKMFNELTYYWITLIFPSFSVVLAYHLPLYACVPLWYSPRSDLFKPNDSTKSLVMPKENQCKTEDSSPFHCSPRPFSCYLSFPK